MANPMFGWSAQDVFTLVQTCDRFFEAYRNGPGGATTRLRNFKEQVENCQDILKFIQDELQKQDREFFFNNLKRDSLKDTLEQCVKIFDKSEFLKPKGEQERIPKAAATVKYLWSDERHVQKLSGILEGHINYIQVFLQLLQSKNTQVQIAHLENHGKHLEKHNQHFQAQYEKMEAIHDDIKQLLTPQFQPRWISRAQSVSSVPFASSSAVVIAPAMYCQGQKSLADVQDLLEQVNAEIGDPLRTDENKNVLRNVQAELEAVEERILKSIERNEAKGVQNVLAESVLREHQEARERRRSRQDSAYASSIASTETYQKLPSPISRRTTDSSGANWNAVNHEYSPWPMSRPPTYSSGPNWNAVSHQETPPPISRRPTNSSGDWTWSADVLRDATSQLVSGPSSSNITNVKICEAEILFNNNKHKPICLPCTVRAKYKGDWLSEIFPDYAGKLPDTLEAPDVPALLFTENAERPIPHIEARGSRADPNRYLVKLMGNTRINPAVRSLEYIFRTLADSEKFQELVFGKKLRHSINMHKIYSGRDKECDKVALRLWMIPNHNPPVRRDYSILYYVNDDETQSVNEHIEIFLHEIEELTNVKGKWLRVRFRAGTPSAKKFKWLEFRLDRKVTEENKTDRATLAKYLDPTWIPTIN